MALNGLFCADLPLRNYSLTHSMGISSPSGTKFGRKKLDTLRYHTVKTRSLYLTWAWISTGSWQADERTELQQLVYA